MTTPTPDATPSLIPLRSGLPPNPTADQFNTWNLQERFLEAYADCGGIYKAAALAGCSARAWENWNRADVFGIQNRFQSAQARYLEKMEIEADRRALDGVNQDIFYQRDKIGTKTIYSDNLLMFRMKKLDPSYRENAQLVDGMVEVITVLDELRRIGTPRVVEALPASEPEGAEGYTAEPDESMQSDSV